MKEEKGLKKQSAAPFASGVNIASDTQLLKDFTPREETNSARQRSDMIKI